MSVAHRNSSLRYCLIGRYLGVLDVPGDDGTLRPACVLERSTGSVHLAVQLDDVLALLSRNPTADVYYSWQGQEDELPWGEADFLAWMLDQGLLVTVRPDSVLSDQFLTLLTVRTLPGAEGSVEGLLAGLVDKPSVESGLQELAAAYGTPVGTLRARVGGELVGALDRQLVFLDRAY